jgi:hypothetical protein
VITADQLVAHAVGDYLLQSDWMAQNKRSSGIAAFAHAAVYTLCFLPFLAPAWTWTAFWQFQAICLSHYLIDRYGLARYVVWGKNFLAPPWVQVPHSKKGWTLERNMPWMVCTATGYPPERPAWLATWLTIIADNILHVLINGWVLSW